MSTQLRTQLETALRGQTGSVVQVDELGYKRKAPRGKNRLPAKGTEIYVPVGAKVRSSFDNKIVFAILKDGKWQVDVESSKSGLAVFVNGVLDPTKEGVLTVTRYTSRRSGVWADLAQN